jgi:hypothetical protein
MGISWRSGLVGKAAEVYRIIRRLQDRNMIF